eukprot:13564149-Ditylum_brightwellii.AAC.1
MIRPTYVPTTFPASTTAASTRHPSPHVNRTFTPNSGHSRQHTQKNFNTEKCNRTLLLLDARDVKQMQKVN